MILLGASHYGNLAVDAIIVSNSIYKLFILIEGRCN